MFEPESLLTRLAAWLKPKGKSPVRVLFELFVAVSLCVNFFYLVRTQCLPKPRDGNQLSAITFCWLAPNFNIPITSVPQFWRTRMAAPAMSSWLTEAKFDYPVDFRSAKCKNLMEVTETADFQNLFGFYHAAWLFLTFAILIWFRADALLIILAVFAGLMYNLVAPDGAYYYPWDMPVVFFFTLVCLFFARGHVWLLFPVILFGGLIKETTLCCALFILLGAHWNWTKRIIGFVTVIVATMAANRLLLAHFGMQSGMFTMNNAGSLKDLFHNTLLPGSIVSLFRFRLNHVLFANAGALFLMLLIPWRTRRDVVFKLVIVIFAAGQFLYGYIDEFRVWYELLPLGWILISEALERQRLPASDTPADPRQRLWTGSYWLVMGTLLAGALGLFLVVQLTSAPAPLNAKSDEDILREKIAAAESGDVHAEYILGQTYVNARNYDAGVQWYQRAAEAGDKDAQFDLGLFYFSIRHDYVAAQPWLQRAADQNHPIAQYYLGMTYANGLAGHQDSDAAVNWLLRAAYQGEMHAQLALGQFYASSTLGHFDLVQAYVWFKVGKIQGDNQAALELAKCTAQMSPAQIAEAEAKLKQLIEPKKQ